MIPDELLTQWVDEGLITPENAQKMRRDLDTFRKEKRSAKIIVSLSTLGSILLGIGTILFIASNWQTIHHTTKTIILTASMLLTYWLGCEFSFLKKTLPKTGASLLLLSTLLFGATLFVVTQTYHFTENHHLLILIWFAAVLPVVYITRLQLIAMLASILYFIWVVLFFKLYDSHIIILILYSALLLFSVGGLHYMVPFYEKIARAYRITGLQVALACLYILTFKDVSSHNNANLWRLAKNPDFFIWGLWIIAIFIGVFTVINALLTHSKSITKIETPLSFCILIISGIYCSSSALSSFYPIIFNLLFFACCLTILLTGYAKEDMKLIAISVLWLILFITARYFDFCWDLLPRSIFFIIGGSILVGGGIILEKQRKKLKEKFSV